MTDATPSPTAAAPAAKRRLLTGDRPTGPLHLGHLAGSLGRRVALQDEHECFFIVADLHTLTTQPSKAAIAQLPGHVRDVVLDMLAAGVDPERATIYLQSGVPAVYDLAILLQMITPVARLEALRSVKRIAAAAGVPEGEISLGLLDYPVLQAADVLMARAEVVPVGPDNAEHLQLARELAATFNAQYGAVFPIPEVVIAEQGDLPGVDLGRGGADQPMAQALGNTVDLKDDADTVARKLAGLGRGADHGDAAARERSPLLAYARAFVADASAADELQGRWLGGAVDEAAMRTLVLDAVQATLAPLRDRRAALARDPGLVEEILVDGTIRAREVAYQTLQRVREAMGLEPLWAQLVAATSRRAEARKRPY
jgi:tryptophanyl-tRNA synthetase